MSGGAWKRRRASLAEANAQWEPPDGFVEVVPGAWEPEEYQPTDWEARAPAVRDENEAWAEYFRCANDLQYFAFTHCWSLDVDDPSGIPQWRKFPVYPYLRRFFQEVQEPSNVHVEKSRQMLMSWAWMVVFLWDILFHENWGDMVLSRRANEVDDGGQQSTPDSLLGKVRAIWTALPPYLQQPLIFKYGLVRHEAIGSYIRGETGTPKAGRGRANKRALMDEAAYIEKSESIFKGLRQAAKSGTCLSSTPNGKGNVFARIRFSPVSTFKKLTFHWMEHPRKAEDLYCTCGWKLDVPAAFAQEAFKAHECKNYLLDTPKPAEPHSPWYDRECQDLTPEGVASELDISYERSRRGRVFEAFDTTRHVVDHTVLVGERMPQESIPDYRKRYLSSILQKGLPCVVAWDFGVHDPTSLMLGQVIDEASMRIRWVDEFETNNESWEFYHAFVSGLWLPIVQQATGLDLMHYGDPAGGNRWSELTSWITNLASRDPKIVIIHRPHRGSLLEWIDFVHNVMRKGNFEVSSWCTHTIDALNNYHWPFDADGSAVPGKQIPVHDEWSHSMSAMRYAYQFRYWERLPDVDHRALSAGTILRTDDGKAAEAPETQADVTGNLRPMNNPKPEQMPRLKYF